MNKTIIKRWGSVLTAGSLLMGLAAPAGYASPIQDAEIIHTTDIMESHENLEGVLSVTEAAYSPAAGNPVDIQALNSSGPPLLITELVPDSTNVPGYSPATDAYEFVEIYNNSAQDINWNDYELVYHGSVWNVPGSENVVIPAGQAIVLWVMNIANTEMSVEQFNLNYSTSLAEGVNLFRVEGGGGMSNSAERKLEIKDGSGQVIVSAAYQNDEQTKPDKGIFYSLPVTGSTEMVMMEGAGTQSATPGQIQPDQIAVPEEESPVSFVLNHDPLTAVDLNQDVEFKASINPSQPGGAVPDQVTVTLQYKTPSQSRYTVQSMNLKDGSYSAVLKGSVLEESSLEYRITAKDSTQTLQTDWMSVQVSNFPEFDSQQVPPLLVTELVPNSKNVGGADGYEFIEVFNNSDRDLNYSNYKMYYRYPDKGASGDVIWSPSKEDLVIPSRESVVFWIINDKNRSLTAADFNTYYSTSLQEDVQLFRMESAGMANSGRRALVLKTNTGREISGAYYDADTQYEDGKTETKEDTGLQYKYPVNGTERMIKISSGSMFPTPGQWSAEQVPAQPVHIENDDVAPIIEDRTGVTESDQGQGFKIRGWAQDDKQVASVTLYMRSDVQQEYTPYRLLEDYGDRHFHHEVTSADLIGKKYLEYYYVVSDGFNETQSPNYRVDITGGADRSDLRLNVSERQLLSGNVVVKGTAEHASPDQVVLRIDGKDITAGTAKALENDAYFAFEAKNVDYYFKNAITMGPEELKDETILYTFLDPIPSYKTLSYPIDASRLVEGEDNTIYIRAGSKSGPFDERVEENKDDFEIRNIRLILANGTVLQDPAYARVDQEIKMGDSAGKHESIGFKFNIPTDQFISKAYTWDTTQVEDGEHEITAVSGELTKSVEVTVDNTAPVITPSIEEGKLYRGPFTLDAEVTDVHAGVKEVTAELNGKKIQLPMDTSSSQLDGGSQELAITAIDNAGNKAEKTVRFEVPAENPDKPELVSPQNGQTQSGRNAELKVRVEDPSGDSMKVSFYRGFLHDAARPEMFKGFQNASDTEPPREEAPAGEQSFTAEDYQSI
ncbi:lamin tail domain-containing protein [Paenibacillus lemnae]|uniref:Lamin tail domain-containing protein n=1 Tax=Paenibacillus lemnae TaxID=1330551 RepID=A0A848M8M6_PAELE|nr:lamin tail domain-containing protein [Paenibacillus lemnae]NMO96561.1 lamin tail domain-containing protein [Paenibacillus lemnae]